MRKRNFRIITFSLLFVGLGIMIAGVCTKVERTQTILLGLTAVFYLAAAINIVVYKSKPKMFDGKTNDSNG